MPFSGNCTIVLHSAVFYNLSACPTTQTYRSNATQCVIYICTQMTVQLVMVCHTTQQLLAVSRAPSEQAMSLLAVQLPTCGWHHIQRKTLGSCSIITTHYKPVYVFESATHTLLVPQAILATAIVLVRHPDKVHMHTVVTLLSGKPA